MTEKVELSQRERERTQNRESENYIIQRKWRQIRLVTDMGVEWRLIT